MRTAQSSIRRGLACLQTDPPRVAGRHWIFVLAGDGTLGRLRSRGPIAVSASVISLFRLPWASSPAQSPWASSREPGARQAVPASQSGVRSQSLEPPSFLETEENRNSTL